MLFIDQKSRRSVRLAGAVVFSAAAAVAGAGNAAPGGAADAETILELADEYRNFRGKSFSFDLELTNYMPGREPDEFGMRAEIKDSHTSLVTYTSPVSEKGKALLMNGRNLWFYVPGNRKPLRITPQQRLLGEASNGDVASTDFSGDYDAAYVGQERLEGEAYDVLELTARPDSMAAYHKLRLWVDRKTHAPYKAHFMTVSGKHVKTAYYRGYEKLDAHDGKRQLTEIEIVNMLSEGRRTVMSYSNFELQDFSDAKFNPISLKRGR